MYIQINPSVIEYSIKYKIDPRAENPRYNEIQLIYKLSNQVIH